jgi:hypothetical protein
VVRWSELEVLKWEWDGSPKLGDHRHRDLSSRGRSLSSRVEAGAAEVAAGAAEVAAGAAVRGEALAPGGGVEEPKAETTRAQRSVCRWWLQTPLVTMCTNCIYPSYAMYVVYSVG